ncbi:MFS transporter [Glaciibacter psychrotolerans]|uniref:MFS family permease n=1 Tax=Glaciibacter psychrotolerans TaxID=670054 RepID=A0A7Z0J6V3_9MICO|nr:MFS transporter [Leifsonia psychrotolerans]NYJ20947.1 MFS family permease [Leifsonia psychrotolerans]
MPPPTAGGTQPARPRANTTESVAASSSAAAPPGSTRGTPPELLRWRNAIYAIFLLSGLCIASWVSRVPAVRDNLQLSTAEVGILIFGLSAGSVIGLIAATGMFARLGARRAMLTSVCISAIGLVGLGVTSTLVPSFPGAFIALAFVGFGMGSLDVMMNIEGAAVEREIGKTLMPFMHACFSFGTVIGALIGAGASALGVPVAWHLIGMAALILTTAIVAVRFVPLRSELGDVTDAPALAWRARLREGLAVWSDLRLLLIGVVMLGMSFAEGSANDWIALASVDGHGMSKTDGAIVFGVFAVAMTAGRVLGGPIIDRFGRVPVLRACALMGVGGLLLFILAPAAWMLYLGTVLWGIGASLGFPVGMSAAADDPKHAAARVSAVAIIGYSAFLVGPPVLGLLGEAFGILNALFLILALMVLAGLAAPAVRERTL